MKRTLHVELSSSDFDQVIAEIRDYKDRILPMRVEEFTNRLADRGIEIAETYLRTVDNLGNVVQLVEFTKDVTLENGECTAIVIATDKRQLARTWDYYGKPKTEWISPTLMAEFGSGQYAIDGHRGTFPRSDGRVPSLGVKDVWHYKGLNGKWYSFQGIKPSQPMYHAINDLYSEVTTIAKEVF